MQVLHPGRWALLLLAVAPAVAGRGEPAPLDPVGVQQLLAETGGAVRVSLHRATGAARFVRVEPGRLPLAGAGPTERAADFFARHGRIFGITNPSSQLAPPELLEDRYGHTHVGYRQTHRGLPVFGGAVRAHFDPAGRLTAANGTFVPDIAVDPRPSWSASAAAVVAIRHVRRELSLSPAEITAEDSRLVVFRSGLLQGVAGRDHLVFEIEVGDGVAVREFVYVDAHTGKVVERISGIHTVLDRKVHQPQLNAAVIWSEGDQVPYSTGDTTNDDQVNGLIDHAGDVFDLFSNLSGGAFLSWDGVGGTMHSVWKPSFLNCPNASWNGKSTNYCDGVASDDVVAHEWGHAYTSSTHGLIYRWQPGALNESYSDIFGEVVDFIDGAGTDSPAPTRTPGDCSTFGGSPPPQFEVTAPAEIAESYVASGASFNPTPPLTVTAQLELVDDGEDEGGGASVSDACQPLVGFTSGRIALIDRGTCTFASKVLRAQDAGAVAVIVVNTGSGVFNMGGSEPAITIPSIMIGHDDGAIIKNHLDLDDVDATIELSGATAMSLRWLMGEDSFSFGGPIRDLWNPNCFGDPGKVSDYQYHCTKGDSGGVHSNSGVPNHAFALLVDGGEFNGQTVAAVGLTKATHLYWRAMEAYQVPSSNFADHADALSQSCSDLLGLDLADLETGEPSGQVLTADDCDEVDQAMLAVEMADPPPCVFQPLLDPDAPPLVCETLVFSDDFETDPGGTWSLSNFGVYAEYVPRDWEWTSDMPDGGSGSAFFALDDIELGNCVEGDDDQSGVMSLESPSIELPGDGVVLAFDHHVATEPNVDGGNLKISVNDGPFEPIAGSEFTFNPYNGVLFSAGFGNTNPMAGEEAFTGADGGAVTGSWGQSQVDLGTHASAGDTVRLRFDFGVDGCNGLFGWYVDNVVVCAPTPAGRVPDGGAQPGTPLTVDKAAGDQIALSWGGSCLAGDDDYEIYEGSLGLFTSHSSKFCSTAGATEKTFEPVAGNTYYLVVPRNTTREGSYGTDSSGVERPTGAVACLGQTIALECDP